MTIHQLSEAISHHAPTYQPNPDLMRILQTVPLGVLIGAAAVGKTTVQQELQRLNARFVLVKSRTTRPRRPQETDDHYYFESHTSQQLQAIYAAMQRGELVQIAHHPAGYIYYTRIEDYGKPGDIPVLTVLGGSAVEAIRQIFPNSIEVAMVTPGDTLLKRLQSESGNRNDLPLRLQEAVYSVEWCLSQPSMLWVINTDGNLDSVVQCAAALFTTGVQSKTAILDGRAVAQDMLRALKKEASRHAASA